MDWIWPIGPPGFPKERTILSVGRAPEDKGHMEAMEAITRALASRPEWRARCHPLRHRQGAAERRGASPRRQSARRAGQDRRGPALRRGQSGMGEGRDRHGADQVARAFRPHGSGGSRQRLGAPHLGPRRSRRSLPELDAVTVDPDDAGVVAAGLYVSLMDSPARRSDLARAGRAQRGATVRYSNRGEARWTNLSKKRLHEGVSAPEVPRRAGQK